MLYVCASNRLTLALAVTASLIQFSSCSGSAAPTINLGGPSNTNGSGSSSSGGATSSSGGASSSSGSTSSSSSSGSSAGPATVSAVSPTGGYVAGGTLITITGTNFATGAGVTVGGVACGSVTVVSATEISCTTAAGSAGTGAIAVTNPGTSAGTLPGSFTLQTAPTITSISPDGGALAGGTAVIISGQGFAPGATVALSGGQTCINPVVNATQTQLTCTVTGTGSGPVNVTVANPAGSGGTSSTDNNGFTFQAAPTVSSITPTTIAAIGGASITITGTGFLASPTVLVNCVACTGVTGVSSTSITCTAPAGTAGPASVKVTNTDTQNQTLSSAFTYESYLYVAQNSNTSWISGAQAPSTGSLTSNTGSITDSGKAFAIATHPTLKMAYMATSKGDVLSYSISNTNGALTAAGSEVSPGALNVPYALVVAPNGLYGFVTNNQAATSGLIIPLTISQSGGTTGQITGSGTAVGATSASTAQGNPNGISVTPNSAHAYVAFEGSSTVCSFSINTSTGALTQITTTTPACASGSSAPANAQGVVVDSTGQYVYAVGNGSSSIMRYNIAGDSSLTFEASAALASGSGATAIIATSTGFLYAADNDGTISYATISGDGSLSAVSKITLAGTSPSIGGLAVDPANKFVYVSDNANNLLRIYSIGSGGALTEISGGGSPFSAGSTISGPLGMAFTPQ